MNINLSRFHIAGHKIDLIATCMSPHKGSELFISKISEADIAKLTIIKSCGGSQ